MVVGNACVPVKLTNKGSGSSGSPGFVNKVPLWHRTEMYKLGVSLDCNLAAVAAVVVWAWYDRS